MTKWLFVLLAMIVASVTHANDVYYVSANTLNVRLEPHGNGKITNKIYRQEQVRVRESVNGWGRISKYYDGWVEGVPGRVARWVSMKYLVRERPNDLPQPDLPYDARIKNLPKVGETGLTEQDVRVLYRGAHYFLGTGKCERIEWGDTKCPQGQHVLCELWWP